MGCSTDITRLDLPARPRNARARRSLTLLLAGAMAAVASAQATDLIISEYLEGSSNNKYIEIYNGTAAGINLANYQLRLYANGSGTVTTTGAPAMTGTLAAGATVVYKNSLAALAVPGEITNSAVAFNGDDAIDLYNTVTTSTVDIIGNIGCDPGTQWTGTGGRSTLNKTLVRKANICTGVTSNPGWPPCTFPTLDCQWDVFNVDDATHLGSHTMLCGPTVNFDLASSAALESAGTVAVNMTISPVTTASTTFTITINGSSTATYGGANDYTTFPAGPGTISVTVGAGIGAASFNVIINDDGLTEGDETIDFTLTNATGGTTLGANLTHQFTITDNDNTPTIEFSTLSVTALEGAPAQTFTLNIVPPIHASFTATFTVANGPGATYGLGNDYITNPPAPAATFVRNVPLNAASVTFTATPLLDGLPESTEWVKFTVSSVPLGFAIGSNDNATLYIGDIDSPPTVLSPGDLAIVGVNANTNGCSGVAGDDEISFFCFKEITYHTKIILTDNGYSRCTPGKWGTGEGTVEMYRTGPAIPAGQVITFRVNGSSPGINNVYSVAPDANWTCASIGILGTALNLNVGGDQLFFMQGDTWFPGTNSGSHDATYDGTVLYAFSTVAPPNSWSASCGSTQRSDRPPGVECFSMAPTLASDFNKYTGPNTFATQRDWIIRIDNQANWGSYPDCGQYDTNGYNWLTAPIMNITVGTMTNGVWRGAINTDWFECKNWDDARLPTAATNVLIGNQAAQNCVVGLGTGLQPGGTAVCGSLLQTFPPGTPKSLIVDVNSTLNIGGALTLNFPSGAGGIVTSVLDNATLKAATVNLSGYTLGATQASLRADRVGSLLQVSGDMNINPGGMLDLYGLGGGTLELGGDFNNAEDADHFEETLSTVVFNGSTDQTITSAVWNEAFYNLTMNKSGGDLLLTNYLTVNKVLNFTQGRILSSTATLLTLSATGIPANMSNASHVDGPMQKIGDTNIVFPIGKNNLYRPAALSTISGGAAVAFTAEYFNASPTTTLGPTGLDHDATLHHVSACEYWRIDRSSGVPNAFVSLSWVDPVSCSVTFLPTLQVAYWTGVLWTARGNGGTNGTTAAGGIISGSQQSSFLQSANYWTLGSLTNANPLPIELLSFTAQPNGGQVDLEWRTASEQNNDHFTVERSADAVAFTALLQVPGAGNSQSVIDYADVDPSPLDGLSYYRLRQTDLDGTTEVSDAVPVYFSGGRGQPLQVLYGDDGLFLMHDFAPGSTLEVMDIAGRVVGSTGITAKGLVKVPLDAMAHGVYLLRMTDGARTESTRVAF